MESHWTMNDGIKARLQMASSSGLGSKEILWVTLITIEKSIFFVTCECISFWLQARYDQVAALKTPEILQSGSGEMY